MKMNLKLLGWNDHFALTFATTSEASYLPARVLSVDKSSFNLGGDFGEAMGKASGRFWYTTGNSGQIPAVGDWVAITLNQGDDFAIIHEILLPRTSCITRNTPGNITEAQVIAANIDTVFIITGLDNNFNPRRIERYIALITNSGAQPVIVLNKSDLVADAAELDEIKAYIETIANDVPTHFVSMLNNCGLSELMSYIIPGKTVAFIGSSGVGKSTLINYFLGNEKQRVEETREKDSRGRHTTTRRQLFLLPSGAMLIDTPGIREIQLWIDDNSIDMAFADIDSLRNHCKFNDCTHSHEPDCAVQAAIEQGKMDADRLISFNKMKREIKYLENRQKKTGWDTRLIDRKFGKLRHAVLKQKKKQLPKSFMP